MMAGATEAVSKEKAIQKVATSILVLLIKHFFEMLVNVAEGVYEHKALLSRPITGTRGTCR